MGSNQIRTFIFLKKNCLGWHHRIFLNDYQLQLPNFINESFEAFFFSFTYFSTNVWAPIFVLRLWKQQDKIPTLE